MDVRKAMDVYDVNHMAMPFGDIVAQKYKSVYLPFSATGTYAPLNGRTYYFRPDPELDFRNCIIKGIQLISVDEAANNLGWGEIKDNLPITTLCKGILYISNTQREVIATLPFHNLIKFANDGKLAMTYFTEQIWQNCYVEFADMTGITQVNGLQFNVFYDER
jgi:hypothetical protein